jgi:hypothetical protein
VLKDLSFTHHGAVDGVTGSCHRLTLPGGDTVPEDALKVVFSGDLSAPYTPLLPAASSVPATPRWPSNRSPPFLTTPRTCASCMVMTAPKPCWPAASRHSVEALRWMFLDKADAH